MFEYCKKNRNTCIVIAVVLVVVIVLVTLNFTLWNNGKKNGDPTTQPAGKPRRAMISVDSRADGDYQTPQATGGRVRPYPCLFMPGGPTQETYPICNENIPWFPPYNRGTWPERFPGRFSSDYAPDYVAPLNERFYQSNIRAQEVAQRIAEQVPEEYGPDPLQRLQAKRMDEKKAKNSLMNSFSRAPIQGANRSPETESAGNEGFTKTNFSAISFPSYPGMYDLRSTYSSPRGTVPQAQAPRHEAPMSLAQANVARTQTLPKPGFATPAHAQSNFSANANLMNRKKNDVPKELQHLSPEELANAIDEEVESMQAFKADEPVGLPLSPDGFDPTRDLTMEIKRNFASQGKGVLSRYANKDVQDKINNLYREHIVPSEEEMEYNIRAYVRPTQREQDYWIQYPAYETRPAVQSVMQQYNYPAYTNQDFTDMRTDGQSVHTRFGP